MVSLPHPLNATPPLDPPNGGLPLGAPNSSSTSLAPLLADNAHDNSSSPSYVGDSSNRRPDQANTTLAEFRSRPMVITIAVAATAVVAVVLIAVVLPFLRRKLKLKKKRDHHKRGKYKLEGDLEEPFPPHPPPPPPPPHLHKHHPHHRRPPLQSNNEAFGKTDFEKSDPKYSTSELSSSWGHSRSRFTYEELKQATNDFSKSNLIGEGGFGYVYKGQLSGGKIVAVKQLKVGGGQGEREFQAEVEIISRVHHRHLVSLVGYCIFENQRLLVYDFVRNKTLDYHLHGAGRPVMDWPTRIKIAIGAARGIAYLHEDCNPRIIHRDIKSSNILLEEDFEAQVSDFGLAKLTPDNHTHESTRIMGTVGYLAPEYASTGKLTVKSDVFSFGVLLLELVTGKKPVRVNPQGAGLESLVDWARPLLAQALLDGNLDPLVDPNLLKAYDASAMLRMIEAAAACVRRSASGRPRMSKVVFALSNESANLMNQGYGTESTGLSDDAAGYNSFEYSANLRKFQQIVLSDEDVRSNHVNDNHNIRPASDHDAADGSGAQISSSIISSSTSTALSKEQQLRCRIGSSTEVQRLALSDDIQTEYDNLEIICSSNADRCGLSTTALSR